MALQALRYDGGWKRRGMGLPQRLVLAQQILQEIDRFQERCIIDTTGEFQIREQVPQIAFEGERQLGVMSPLATRLVEFNVAHKVGNHRERSGSSKENAVAFTFLNGVFAGIEGSTNKFSTCPAALRCSVASIIAVCAASSVANLAACSY